MGISGYTSEAKAEGNGENTCCPEGWPKPAVHFVEGLGRMLRLRHAPFSSWNNRFGPTELIQSGQIPL
ncbi:hypothetical protein GGQ72_000719 [Rhizobium rhizoryzae]|uniref:Uncharacterized protein n=1 Tax=Rhizobium rhizoryzae TaxID=451876 RepID=A0A7W6LD73_9HYPH|nr:hypothetical protein [Rhizobium rhizoryzae]